MWFKIYCFIIKLFRIKVEGYSNLDFEIEKKERELLSSLSVSLDSAKIEIDLILYNNKHKASLKQVNDINLSQF